MTSVNEQTIVESDDYPDQYLYTVRNNLYLPPYVTPERLEFCRDIVPRLNDICFVSYPKSGSSWLSYILSHLAQHGNKPDRAFLNKHIIWPESSIYTFEELEQASDPRIFKSHMPYDDHFIGSRGHGIESSPMKYIYIARNPKDVMVSYYEFEYDKPWSNYHGTWEQWFTRFINGHVQRGDWFDHVFSWYEKRHLPNLLIIWYEDLILHFHSTVDRIAKFWNINHITDEMIEKIYQETKFIAMRKENDFITRNIRNKFCYKDAIGQFFRSGVIGSWKKRFTVEQSELFDQIIQQRIQGKNLPPIIYQNNE